MHRIYSIAIIILCFISSLSCDQNRKSKESAEDLPPATTPVIPEESAKMYTYLAMVNDLRIRETAGKTGAVVGKVSIGDHLVGNNEQSPEKYHANFRDVPYHEPYIKMIQIRDSKNTGWVYGGGIQLVYRSNQPKNDLQGISGFARFIDALDPKSADSGEKIFAYLREFVDNFKTQADVDAVYILTARFLQLQTNILWKETERMNWTDADMQNVSSHAFQMDQNPITAQLEKSGFGLETSEGLVYPIVNSGKVKEAMPGTLSPPMQSFIIMKKMEEYSAPLADAGIRISLDEIAKRAYDWKSISNNYPNFVLSDISNKRAAEYLSYLLVGTSNSMAFDYESNKLYEHVRKAWEDALDQYPNSWLSDKIKKAIQILDQNNSVKNEAFDTFIADLN